MNTNNKHLKETQQMFFKKKKELTEQEQYLYQLYRDRLILNEMITQYKIDRQTLIDILKDIVRHTEPTVKYSYPTTTAFFNDLAIGWHYEGADKFITAYYKGRHIASDIAEDLYNLYRAVWG